MEILHFCPSRSFSGLEQYALEVAIDQKKRGRNVAFVVSPGSQLEQECRKHEIETVVFDPYSLFWPLRFWPRLKKIFSHERNLKVIHLHSTQELLHLSLPLFLMKRSSERPKVILQSHIWINHRKRDPFHRVLYSLVDEVWCSSEAARASLTQNLPVSPEKIKIIRYGRDVDSLCKNFLPRDDARKHLGLNLEGIYLGCVSRLEESKGILNFLEASQSLLTSHPELHVVIIGGASPNDPAAEKYKEQVEQLKNRMAPDSRNRVHLLGMIPESYRFLKAFDVYVLPSFQETFSLSLLDAQLAGLPVVGSDSGGTPDVVREGQTGWLFSSGDSGALKNKLSEAISRKELWVSYGARAAETVKREFNQKTVFQDILTAYEAPRETK